MAFLLNCKKSMNICFQILRHVSTQQPNVFCSQLQGPGQSAQWQTNKTSRLSVNAFWHNWCVCEALDRQINTSDMKQWTYQCLETQSGTKRAAAASQRPIVSVNYPSNLRRELLNYCPLVITSFAMQWPYSGFFLSDVEQTVKWNVHFL